MKHELILMELKAAGGALITPLRLDLRTGHNGDVAGKQIIVSVCARLMAKADVVNFEAEGYETGRIRESVEWGKS